LQPPQAVLKKILVGLILFFMGALAAFLLSFFMFSAGVSSSWGHHPLLPVFVVTVLSVIAYKPTDRWVKKFLSKYFFQKKSFAQLTLMELAADLAVNLDLQEISNLIVNTFGEVLHLKTVALFVPDPLQNNFEAASAFGWTISASKRIRLAVDTPPSQAYSPNWAARSGAWADPSEPDLAGSKRACAGFRFPSGRLGDPSFCERGARGTSRIRRACSGYCFRPGGFPFFPRICHSDRTLRS
jgi:hypothetical protein